MRALAVNLLEDCAGYRVNESIKGKELLAANGRLVATMRSGRWDTEGELTQEDFEAIALYNSIGTPMPPFRLANLELKEPEPQYIEHRRYNPAGLYVVRHNRGVRSLAWRLEDYNTHLYVVPEGARSLEQVSQETEQEGGPRSIHKIVEAIISKIF